MGLYGNQFLTEEAVILNEMNFTRKDLQDPKTLDKIINSKEKFKSVADFLSTLFIIIGIIGSLALMIFTNFLIASGGIIVIINILIKICLLLKDAPIKSFEKNNKKYEDSVRKLIEKSKEAIEKDPKNKEKYQNVITNCNKVLFEINDRRKKAKELKRREALDETIDAYNEFIDWCKKPYIIGHTGENGYLDMFEIPRTLGIPESVLINNLKEKGKYKSDWSYLYGDDIPNFFRGDQYIQISSDDDYSVFYSKNRNKIYFTDATTEYKETSLYKQIIQSNYTKENILEADKELGYYIASKCPEQVKKKEFPIKLK